MTDPQLAHTYEWGRMYARTRGGEPEVPSITTVLGVEAQSMEWWAALCAVDATVAHIDRVKGVLVRDNWTEKRSMRDWLKDASVRDRDAAAARGDIVHNYAEHFALHVMGRASDADLRSHRERCTENGLDAFVESFHRFWDRFDPEPLFPEATVWNAEVGYAGTTDLICNIKVGSETVQAVLDWKTKKSLFLRNGTPKDKDLQVHTGMQLAAAAYAKEAWIAGETPEQDTWVPWDYQPEIGLGVAIGPDGYAVRQYDIYDPLVWQGFKALRSAWDYTRDGARTMGPRAEPGDLKRLTPRPATLD